MNKVITSRHAEIECLKRIANVLNLSDTGKFAYNPEKVVTHIKGNETCSGFTTICTELCKDSSNPLVSVNLEINAQTLQWLDYCGLFVVQAFGDKHTISKLLLELNECLSTKSYLVGHTLTIADISLFFSIQNIMLGLTTYDKENYIHLSRWFNHIQQIENISSQRLDDPVNFYTIHMIGWAKGTRL